VVLARETILRHAQTSLLRPELLEVGGQASALELWHAVLLRAERENRVEAVVAVVLEENPGADELRATWERFRRRKPEAARAGEPERSRKPHAAVIGAAATGIGIVAAAVWLGRGWFATDPPSEVAGASLVHPYDEKGPAAPPSPIVPSATIPAGVAAPKPEPWVEVPAGSAVFGSCTSSRKCPERRTTEVPRFEILRTEVTVAEYRECVDAGVCAIEGLGEERRDVCKMPLSSTRCHWRSEPGDHEDHPINCVDWFQAQQYCAWIGGRLPSDDEWEKAARGSEGHRYPWGDHADPKTLGSHANGYDLEGVRAASNYSDYAIAQSTRARPGVTDYVDGFPETAPVASFPEGASPYGVLDALGNVREWTWERRQRGGSWRTGHDYNVFGTLVPDVAWRDAPTVPGLRDVETGFRCVRSTAEPPGAAPAREPLPEPPDQAWIDARRKDVETAAENVRRAQAGPDKFLDYNISWVGHDFALFPMPPGQAPLHPSSWLLERVSTALEPLQTCLAPLKPIRGTNAIELNIALRFSAPGDLEEVQPKYCAFVDRPGYEKRTHCPQDVIERAITCIEGELHGIDYRPLCRGGTAVVKLQRSYSP